MKQKNLKVNFIYNLIGQVLILVVSLVTTPYISRILREDGNGQYSYAFSIVTYFVLFANLGFNIYGQREIARVRDDEEKRSRAFWEIFIIRFCFTTVSFLTLLIITFTIGFGDKYNNLILILSLLVLGAAFDVNFLFQGLENFKLIATRNVALKIITIIGVFLLVKQEDHNWIYALCISVSTFLSYIVVWPNVLKNIKKVKIKDLEFKRHFKPAILIFIPTLSVTIYTVLDKTMIGLFAPNADYENGCYEQAYKINNIVLTLICVISPILIPRNSNDFSSGNIEKLKSHLKFACNFVLIFSIPIIAGFLVLSDNLSSWFLGDGFEDVPKLLRIMSIRLLVGGLSAVFGEQLFIAIKKEKYHTLATMVAAFINIIINLLLIPRFGATGAAIATAISEIIVMLVLSIFVLKTKYIDLKNIFKMSIKYIIAAVLMFEVITIMQGNMGYSFLTFLFIVVIGGIVYGTALLLMKDEFVLNMINFVLNKLKMKKDENVSE